ncbi:hypothetical protein WA1_47230 [Scytonema hofmannii PCC 7110]|uniref:Uncharacterized protein n=1 Tax=Scytonema hofmannii PCC 7110 TaxID=128403 RepID=A0A139WXU4_9CYAN|nr:hypothetical protein WA1_47230 [Scytonema hofmannii PCC 7110]
MNRGFRADSWNRIGCLRCNTSSAHKKKRVFNQKGASSNMEKNIVAMFVLARQLLLLLRRLANKEGIAAQRANWVIHTKPLVLKFQAKVLLVHIYTAYVCVFIDTNA